MEAFLHHPSLHNAKHILYFALHVYEKLSNPNTKINIRTCKKEDPEDFMGHKFQILAIPFFPISDFKRNSEELGTTYTPLDSVDIRMMNSFTAHANFTYEVREPWDGLWGVDSGNGNWTGIVGFLQHQRADFGFDLNLTPTRLKVLDFSIPYVRESIAIFSLKPGLLPQHLAIIRPFTKGIWLILFVSFLVWSVTLWLMQKAWSVRVGGHSMRLSSSFLYGWSSLMERWTFNPPVNLSSRVLVGLWLLACEILTNTYRSSLVAHLIVQDKMPGINSFQDVLARDGWGWGTSFSSGALMLFFKYHPYSHIQEIYNGMQHAPAEEQFRRVLKGSYSHITYKNFGTAIVTASFTDSRGYTPIHLSRTEYLQFLGIGWGFRFID
ncbi:glutamate receptor ionotropic, kainate 4-like [Panulirus ornatus]|uniref:glutamate receptor ionotropic, kainate 4-like n=1 Tax=Panulirus ornatus TaxID=150431 RepID=UPI003A880456